MLDRQGVKHAFGRLDPRWRAPVRKVLITPLRAYLRYAPTEAGKRGLWNGLAAHLWWLEGEVEAPTAFGARLRVDASDIVGRYIYYFGVWEPTLTAWLRRALQPGDVFVDVGANVGYFSALASSIVGPSGGVVAVEALPEIHERLVANLAGNGVKNARTMSVAAWDREESLQMFTRATGPAGTTTAYASWADRWDLVSSVQVAARPLTAILSADEVRRARVIKIDAEGAEWRIVQGLAELLTNTREDLEVMLEVAPALLAEDGATPSDLADLFAGHGFQAYRVVNDYSAAAYIGRNAPAAPTRMAGFPEGTEQYDVIFSRSRAEQL